MNKTNFLLGKGERLTESIQVSRRGGPKEPPYTFEEAKRRLIPKLHAVVNQIDSLPENTTPNNIVVARLVLNPEYLAKSYFPKELLRAIGLEAMGSKSVKVLPEKRSKGRTPVETVTTEIFISGKRENFKMWSQAIQNSTEADHNMAQIVEIEDILLSRVEEKLKNMPSLNKPILFEVVLHKPEDFFSNQFLNKFKIYLNELGIKPNLNKVFDAGGLYFMEIESTPEQIGLVAKYSLVRVIRKMPSLRMLKPALRMSTFAKETLVKLPDSLPVDKNVKVAIFDGGIPVDHPLKKWVRIYETNGVKNRDNEGLAHGVGVTSAFLFGSINPMIDLPVPFCYVDHYRVLDDNPIDDPLELFEILQRIDDVLSTTNYDMINLSLGPNLPIDDDEVHVWTAVIDQHLSSGDILATIAVGNDGEGDAEIGANRVQVPSDCVNGLSVGACDTPGTDWLRAPYSSVGPGRRPGATKPDLVDFGGSLSRPFIALDYQNGNSLWPTSGTSFSAPSVLRLASGIRAHFGSDLGMLAIKTLLIHSSNSNGQPIYEVGWGKVASDLEDIVTCNDNTVRVVYQGKISAAKYIRARIPLLSNDLKGKIKITATLCFATSIDPHYPDSYTKSGLEITFRPHKDKRNKKTPDSMHAESKPFFTDISKDYLPEDQLRKDSKKWENCLHASKSFLSKSLEEPMFDIHYNARTEGMNDTKQQELYYALVVTVEASKVVDFYNKVVRKYTSQLEQMQPVIDIPIKLGKV